MPNQLNPVARDPARQAALDAAAQKEGFHNYEEYRLFQEQLARKHQGTIEGAAPAPRPSPTPAPNALNHPSGLAGVYNYISSILRGGK